MFFRTCLRLKTHYDVLKVDQNCSQEEIKAAYFTLSKKVSIIASQCGASGNIIDSSVLSNSTDAQNFFWL